MKGGFIIVDSRGEVGWFSCHGVAWTSAQPRHSRSLVIRGASSFISERPRFVLVWTEMPRNPGLYLIPESSYPSTPTKFDVDADFKPTDLKLVGDVDPLIGSESTQKAPKGR